MYCLFLASTLASPDHSALVRRLEAVDQAIGPLVVGVLDPAHVRALRRAENDFDYVLRVVRLEAGGDRDAEMAAFARETGAACAIYAQVTGAGWVLHPFGDCGTALETPADMAPPSEQLIAMGDPFALGDAEEGATLHRRPFIGFVDSQTFTLDSHTFNLDGREVPWRDVRPYLLKSPSPARRAYVGAVAGRVGGGMLALGGSVAINVGVQLWYGGVLMRPLSQELGDNLIRGGSALILTGLGVTTVGAIVSIEAGKPRIRAVQAYNRP